MYICLVIDGGKIMRAAICDYTSECKSFFLREEVEFMSDDIKEPITDVFVLYKNIPHAPNTAETN